jgi:hypothetical protein
VRLVGLLIRNISNGCKRIGVGFFRITQLLDTLLPALFSPAQLPRLIHVHYVDTYHHAPDAIPQRPTEQGSWTGRGRARASQRIVRYNRRAGSRRGPVIHRTCQTGFERHWT